MKDRFVVINCLFNRNLSHIVNYVIVFISVCYSLYATLSNNRVKCLFLANKSKERHAQDNCPVKIIIFFIDCQDPRLQFRDPMDDICKAGKNGTYSNATNTNATKKQNSYIMHYIM